MPNCNVYISDADFERIESDEFAAMFDELEEYADLLDEMEM